MEGNRTWAKGCKEEMPDLLPKLATGQVRFLLPLFRYIVPLPCVVAGRAGGNRRSVIEELKSRTDDRHQKSSGLDV
jgi:hypothetical protein